MVTHLLLWFLETFDAFSFPFTSTSSVGPAIAANPPLRSLSSPVSRVLGPPPAQRPPRARFQPSSAAALASRLAALTLSTSSRVQPRDEYCIEPVLRPARSQGPVGPLKAPWEREAGDHPRTTFLWPDS